MQGEAPTRLGFTDYFRVETANVVAHSCMRGCVRAKSIEQSVRGSI